MNDIKHPQLKIVSELNKGTVFILSEEKYTCGRSELNDIIFTDSSVSSKHCELLKNGNTYIIRDISSANGTIVNNAPIEERELKNNDLVNIGGVELLYDGGIIEEKNGKKSKKANSESSEEMSISGAKTGINFDSYNNKTSLIEMKNISPFVKSKNRLPQIAITTVVVLLALVVIGLLIWLFAISF